MPCFVPFVIKPLIEDLVFYKQLFVYAEQLSEQYRLHSLTETDLKVMGEWLWQSLHIENSFDNAHKQTGYLALVIVSDDQRVHSLPWECLYHPQLGFLAKHQEFTLSRQKTCSIIPRQSLATNPIKILLFTAQTTSLVSNTLLLDNEIAWLHKTLQPAIYSGQVQLCIVDDGRLATLEETVQTHPWHLVILSGHGKIEPETEQSFFVFEGDTPAGEKVSATSLARVFQTNHVECLVLSSCYSSKSYYNSPSLIEILFQTGIPHVIGMRELVVDRASHLFIRQFCMELIQHGRVDIALQRGRQAMTQLLTSQEVWHDHRDHSTGQWALPQLLAQDPIRPLFDENRNVTRHSRRLILGHSIPLPDTFIGRRQELHYLVKALVMGKIRRLFITGQKGVGKTALAGQLVNRLIQYDYSVYRYQVNHLNFSDERELQKLLKLLLQESCVLWLDGIKENFLDTSFFIALKEMPNQIAGRILLTSRYAFSLPNYEKYQVFPLNYQDFCRYIQQLGLCYQPLQLRLLYEKLAGNLVGINLLQTMPFYPPGAAFSKQLAIIQRYMQAHQ